jgi:uncharacterized protein YjbJ (UPF0337 family)
MATGGEQMSFEDKAKNKAQSAKGSAKEAAGRAKNDRSLETEGKVERAMSDLKQAAEKVKDAIER